MKHVLMVAGLVCGLAACATSKQEIKDIRKENDQLKKQQYSLQEKVDGLSSSLSVLQDRLETMKLALDRQTNHPVSSRHISKPKKMRRSLPRKDSREPFLIAQPESVQKLPTLNLSNQDLDRADQSIQTPTPHSSSQEEDDARATEVYNRAFAQYEAKKFPQAYEALNQFVKNFKEHPYADNAVFWIGEGHFQEKKYASAVKQFERVVREFPQGNKVPDALLRAGSCYLRLSRPKKAQESFDRLIKLYPQSIAAQKAKTWLAEINRNPSKGRM